MHAVSFCAFPVSGVVETGMPCLYTGPHPLFMNRKFLWRYVGCCHPFKMVQAALRKVAPFETGRFSFLFPRCDWEDSVLGVLSLSPGRVNINDHSRSGGPQLARYWTAFVATSVHLKTFRIATFLSILKRKTVNRRTFLVLGEKQRSISGNSHPFFVETGERYRFATP